MESKQPLADITSQALDASNIAEDEIMAVEKYVIKRDGSQQSVSPLKLKARLEKLMEGLVEKHINLDLIINKTVSYAQNGNITDYLKPLYRHQNY